MTTPQNNVDRIDRNYTPRLITVTTDQTINAGDLVLWDTTSSGGKAKNTLIPAGGSVAVGAANFVGMSTQSNAQQIYPNDADQPGVEVLVRGVVWLTLKTGDVAYMGTPLYCATSTDAQTVQVSASGTLVGYAVVDPPAVGSPRANPATPAPESVTGASGVRIAMILAPNAAWAAAL